MPILALLALGVTTAYLVSLVGPSPRPAPLTPGAQAQLDATTAASQQAAASAAQAQATLAALQSGELFQPGFQGQPGATVSGVLVSRGEVTRDGYEICYDCRGQAHYLHRG